MSDDEGGHDGDVEDEGDHKQSNLIGESSFSKKVSSSNFINNSARLTTPNSSTILMMMKGKGDNQIPKIKSSVSSSTSSSLLVDEHRQIKPRPYNFVSVPFNGTRLIAKSTEQLNHSPTSILKKNFVQKYIPCSSKKMHAHA